MLLMQRPLRIVGGVVLALTMGLLVTAAPGCSNSQAAKQDNKIAHVDPAAMTWLLGRTSREIEPPPSGAAT